MMYMTMNEKIAEECRDYIENSEYVKCEQMLRKAMEEEPHSAVPHNLMGILLEKRGQHSMAMKHFRAAYALDPTCEEARFNLDHLAQAEGEAVRLAFSKNDCLPEKRTRFFMQITGRKWNDSEKKNKKNDEKNTHHSNHFVWNFN